jgi:hypothetical protein
MKRSGSIFLTLTVVMGLCGILPILAIEDSPSSLAFFNIFGKQQKEDWKTVDEMRGLVDDRLYEVMECYAAMRTNESVVTQRLGPFFSYQVKLRTEPVFMIKNNTVYVRDRTTAEAGRLITWGYRLGLLRYPGGMSYPLPFEARCLMKVNETHYKLSVAFYEQVYLKKMVVLSAVTPKDYEYPRDYLAGGWFKREEHKCRLLRMEFGGEKPPIDNPPIPCHYMDYQWDRPNPLTVGFAREFERLLDEEKLPKNVAITIATKFANVLMDYLSKKPDKSGKRILTLYDPVTKSVSKLELPEMTTIYYPEDVDWRSMLEGYGWCGSFARIVQYILRDLGLDVYYIGINITGAHAVLGVNEKDIIGAKGIDGVTVVVVQRDDGLVVRIRVLEVSDVDRPHSIFYLNETKHMAFVQYNSV